MAVRTKTSSIFVMVFSLSISGTLLASAAEAPSDHVSRHRRFPNPNPELRTSEEQKENVFRPKFRDCDNYKPEVEEESRRGTKVIQVVAQDGDEPSTPSGRVTYSIVSTHSKFTIDKNSGVVSTNAIFNRDEPDREKLVHVTVKATDHGRPRLEDVCTLAVRIKDKNDNGPVFDRSNYNVPVAQDTVVGTQIMRISATDVDEGVNQKVTYELETVTSKSDIDYFQYDYKTGVVSLKKRIDKPIGHNFLLKATASDGGTPPRSTEIRITLEVRESDKKPPSFVHGLGEIELREGYSDYFRPVANYTAQSNIAGDDQVFFQLVNGRTEKTNKGATFRAIPQAGNPHAVSIYLSKALSYEKVNEYTLTLQVRNSPDLVAEAQLRIKILDENNRAPIFTNVESGTVLEHEPSGTFVMQVSAIDNDGTYPNHRVTYKISPVNPPEIRKKFAINSDTGIITTLEEFDREERAVYAVTIDAEDGAPSSLLMNGLPNKTPNKFRIAIADKNDNPPYFPKQLYRAEVPEDQDVQSKVIEVRAEDLDTEASVTTYQILSGNVGDKFTIEETTGFIRVAEHLDYEDVRQYNLTVSAWDGSFGNRTRVLIKILNVNDMKPQFSKDKYRVEQLEEIAPNYPIFQVSAIDPDIGDPSGEQNITYYLDPDSQLGNHFSIDERTGNLRIVKKLNRDLPDGYPSRTMYIFAKDENGGPTGIESFVEFQIDLIDVNDNAPFLDMPEGMVWPENANPGQVGVLVADDYDAADNGPPFTFELDATAASSDVRSWFGISALPNGSHVLITKTRFDREQRKRFSIPVRICDHKNRCATSDLDLVIGDVNDNPMKPGSSDVFVYNYEGLAPDTQIGRVFVRDPDDWDLPDKTFQFKEAWKWERMLALDRNTGMITMRRGINFQGKETLNFQVDFLVEDPVHGQTGGKSVPAKVNITVRKISREAVMKSGSVRISGPPEDFIRPTDGDGFSKRDQFAVKMKRYLNASRFDVFTVLPAEDGDSNLPHTDVRFSARGSPYYAPEKMEGAVARRKRELQLSLGIDITMVRIDECLREKRGKCAERSCKNQLQVRHWPVSVYTNTTSFVGVQARVVPDCSCSASPFLPTTNNPCGDPNPCLNDGKCVAFSNGGYRCECPRRDDDDDRETVGERCQQLAASFNGQGWSWHQGLPACGSSHLSLVLRTQYETGTLLYAGPFPNTLTPNLTDFFLLEMVEGRLKLHVNFGSGTEILQLKQQVADNSDHEVTIRWTNDTVQMELDDKTCLNEISTPRESCFKQISTHNRKHRYLNTNGPLHVGGISFGEAEFHKIARAHFHVKEHEMPHARGFAGCIKNLTFFSADQKVLYDLGSPSDGENFTPRCDAEFVQAVVATNLNMNFLVAILVSVAVLLVVIIILAVCRKRKHIYNDKDIDCDIRENIINYEDEGGGEGDQTGYDLSVLRLMSEGTPALHSGDRVKLGGGSLLPPEAAPDIQTFLQTNKDRIDNDPEATPYDDLRHYAYEGDGDSVGSLSSLNSGTSDGDLEFDYLHNFGPRFKKLADMYGEQSDSEDSFSEREGGGEDVLPSGRIRQGHNKSSSYGNSTAPSNPNSPHYNYDSSNQATPLPPPHPSESWC